LCVGCPTSLRALIIPQLSPDDDEMASLHKRYLASMSSRSGPSNALSNSTLLDDEEPTAAATKDREIGGPPPKPPPEQRILLLQGLLAIGDLPASLLILGKFPWVGQSHPQIADLIMRMVAYALKDVYRSVADDRVLDHEEGDLEMEELAPTAMLTGKEIVPTLLTPCPPSTPTKTFEFFYPDWREGVEKWSNTEDLLEKGLRWLLLVRGLGGRTVDVEVKICRIAAEHFIALRKAKEGDLGFAHGARTKDEIRLVEVSD